MHTALRQFRQKAASTSLKWKFHSLRAAWIIRICHGTVEHTLALHNIKEIIDIKKSIFIINRGCAKHNYILTQTRSVYQVFFQEQGGEQQFENATE